MKQLFRFWIVAALLLVVGCSKEYDDSALVGRVDDLESRVQRLEQLCQQMNTNISSLQTIVTALQNNDYVTGVTPITENGKTIGYTITFAKAESITIYHGKDGQDGADGKDGQDGTDGKDGQDGTDGKDGYTPVIGVKQDTDGIYYWTLDGDWLLDNDGNKIKAQGLDGKNGADGKDGEDGKDGQDGADGKDGENGKDGVDGEDGADGKDGITPQLKIENDYWYVSYDNGASWTQLGKATGEDGKDGANGANGANGADGTNGVDGKDGKDGKDGDSFFQSVDTSNSEYVVFTLADGTQIQLPTWYAFEQLRTLCNQMNTNITSLQSIVNALQNRDYITTCTPLMEDGVQIGYTITFKSGKTITIYHGKNGADGKDGQDGANGKDGKDGYTPQIGVKQAADDIYYWTLDGDWLLDNDGNKIKAQGLDGKNGADGKDGENGKDGVDGEDGADGENGADGKDGITPQLKIENDYWYVSYDNGASWTQLGKATGEDGKDGTNGTDGKDGEDGQDGSDGSDGADGKDGDSFFQSVTQDESNVYFTLADGTVITVPKGLALSIEFDESDLVVMSPNSTREIGYTVTSATDAVKVEVTSSADIKAKAVADDANGLTGKIHIATSATIDEYSKVIVFVSNGDKVIMRSITFEEAGLVVEDNATKQAASEGGEMTLEFLSNVECEVVIPKDAQSWISVVPATRALEKQTITLKLEPNTSYYRSATVTVQSTDGKLSIDYTIEQDGDLGAEIDPTQIPDNEIWYRTTDNQIYNINYCTETFGSQYLPFNANVISNTYLNGLGVIKCDAAIKTINWCAFRGYNVTTNNITELYLPDCVETISDAAIEGTELTTLHIPENLKQYGGNSNLKMEKFTGKYVSEDGRCVIIDEVLCAFAPKDISEYTIPQGVRKLQSQVMRETNLHSVVLSEGLEEIGYASFYDCTNLKTITFPSTLQTIKSRAFEGCYSIENFYGNERFHTSDNKCLIQYTENIEIPNSYGKWIQLFAGKDLTEYTIPEGIIGILEGAFSYCPNLKHLTLPNSLVDISIGAFGLLEGDQSGIEAVYGENTSEDNKCFVIDGELKYFIAKKGVQQYNIPDGITSIGHFAFAFNYELQAISMNDDVTKLGSGCFVNCQQLKTVTLSANIKEIASNPFETCQNLHNIFLRSLVPPLYSDQNMNSISDDIQIYVPQQSLVSYQKSAGWSLYKDYFVGYDYSDLPSLDYYISSDYSKDGEIITLQEATIGNGIDIIFLGDAYSDRQIEDGTYKADMEKMHEHFFSEEPFKSFKDYFNVYYVNVVSATEGYKNAGSRLMGYYDGGWPAQHAVCFDYAKDVVGEERMDETVIVIGYNSDVVIGNCYFYRPDKTNDYGSGVTIACLSIGVDDEIAKQLLHHEACGHGFAKLADEYVVLAESIPEDQKNAHKQDLVNYGWWKNVDYTDNSETILWSKFLKDERYANSVGIYEGGNCYGLGCWRPTENSIMRYNTGGFNAPSREAIYYRIHKLAYGDSWEYDYEDFVEWDARNRATAATRAMVYKPANYKPTHPPVIVNKSWKDAK